MHVSNLQQFLRLLAPALKASGLSQPAEKGVTKGLEDVADALQPFHDMTTEHLADWLGIAAEYRRTGVLPDIAQGKKPSARTPKAPKPLKMTTAEAVAFLQDLQQRALNLDPAQVTQEIQTLEPLTVPDLKAVQREYLGVTSGSKKPELLAAFQRKIDTFRATRDRVEGILAQ